MNRLELSARSSGHKVSTPEPLTGDKRDEGEHTFTQLFGATTEFFSPHPFD